MNREGDRINALCKISVFVHAIVYYKRHAQSSLVRSQTLVFI